MAEILSLVFIVGLTIFVGFLLWDGRFFKWLKRQEDEAERTQILKAFDAGKKKPPRSE